MEYMVIEDTDFQMFHRVVQGWLDRGWTLQGGISVCMISEGEFAYFQAITKAGK